MGRSFFFLAFFAGIGLPSTGLAQASLSAEKALEKLQKTKSRSEASRAFLREGSRWQSSAPKLLALYGPDPALNKQLVVILRGMGTSLRPLLKNEIKKAQGPRLEASLKVVSALGEKALPLLPTLFEASQNGSVERREQMLRAMAALPSETVTPILRVALKDKNPKIALAGAWGLGRLGRWGRGGNAALREVWTKGEASPKLKAQILESLGAIGFVHPRIPPLLKDALKDKDPLIQAQGFLALARNQGELKSLQEPLLRALKSDDETVRGLALKSLKLLGGKGQFAKSALESMFRKKRALRLDVYEAYITIERESRFGIYELLAMFPRETPGFRARALYLLAAAGPRNPVIIAELFKWAEKAKSLETRGAAMAALAVYPRFADQARSARFLSWIREAPTLGLKCRSVALFGRHGAKTEESRVLLRKELNGASPELRRVLVKSLGMLGGGGQRWVRDQALRDETALSFECALQFLRAKGRIEKNQRELWLKSWLLGMKQARELKDWNRASLGLKIMARCPWEDARVGQEASRWLKDPRDEFRLGAIKVLARQPGLSEDALFGAMTDAWREVRRHAALAFFTVKEPKKGLLRKLEGLLGDSELGFEVAAVLVSIADANRGRKARRLLDLALNQGDFRVYRLFQRLREKASGSVADLMKEGMGFDPRLRVELAKTLAYCKGAEAKKALETLLRDASASVQAAAIEALVLQGSVKAKALEKTLLSLLGSSELLVQGACLRALAKVGSKSTKRGLARFQTSKEPSLLEASAMAVATLGKDSFKIIDGALSKKESQAWGRLVMERIELSHGARLIRFFKDASFDKRRRVCLALGGRSRAIFEELRPLLRRDDASAKLAWEIFGEYGEDALECLVAEVATGHKRGLESAARGLRLIGPAAVPPLLVLLRSKNVKERRYGARALGIVGSVNSRVGTALLGALEDKDLRVRAEAAGGLGSCRLAAQRPLIVSGLLRALADPSRKIRVRAVESFGRLGEVVADVALPELKKGLASWDKDIRRESLRSLAAMGTKRFAYVADVVAALKDSEATVRRAAIETLSDFGVHGKAALKALEKVAAVDTDIPSRLAASQAIESIQEAIREQDLEKDKQ